MDGFLNVLKPSGITSHDLVLSVRRVSGEDRTGHLGTLDPMAVGVLPIALGTYRRLSEYFLGEDKRYLAEFRFGVTSDTGDMDGNVTETVQARGLSEGDVISRMPEFTGVIPQVPPAYSALKIKGRRLYDWAREGIDVRIKPRNVAIHEFRLVGWKPGLTPRGLFSMKVGRGTYVRSLASSLGESLGCGAVVSYLLRVSSGAFHLKDSVTLSELQAAHAVEQSRVGVIDPLRALSAFPQFEIIPHALNKIIHGVELSPGDFVNDAEVASRSEDQGTFLAYERDATGFPRVLAVVYRREGRLRYEKVLTRESDMVANRRTD